MGWFSIKHFGFEGCAKIWAEGELRILAEAEMRSWSESEILVAALRNQLWNVLKNFFAHFSF